MEDLEQIEQEEKLSPQPSLKRKYLLIGVIIALAILIGGAGILVLLMQKEAPSQVPEAKEPDVITKEVLPEESPLDETADWHTYRSEKFGFEFEAPSTMKVESWYSTGFMLSLKNQKGNESIFGWIEVRARILNVEEVQEGKKYLEDTRAADIGSEVPKGSKMIKVENINLGDCVGVQTQFKNENLITGCLKENLSISAILVADLESTEEYKILYNEILSTFRFLEADEIEEFTVGKTVTMAGLEFMELGRRYDEIIYDHDAYAVVGDKLGFAARKDKDVFVFLDDQEIGGP